MSTAHATSGVFELLGKALFRRAVEFRPGHALLMSCESLGVGAIELPLPPSSPLYREGDAESVLLRPDLVILPEVVRNKQWQIGEAKFLAAHAWRPSILVDVGANQGLMTRQLMHLQPNLQAAICFEPHPQNFHALEKNLSHLPQCRLVNVGLGATAGEFHFYEDPSNAGNYSLNPDAMRSTECRLRSIQCISATQDNILGNLPADLRSLPMIWKSDTQGYDETIMTALPDEFWSRVDAGVMEIFRVRRPSFDVDRLADILNSFRFRVFADTPRRQAAIREIVDYCLGNGDHASRDLYFSRSDLAHGRDRSD